MTTLQTKFFILLAALAAAALLYFLGMDAYRQIVPD